MNQKITTRSRGNVVTLIVELDASQAREFNRVAEKLGLKKVDAVSAAINIWLGMVVKAEREAKNAV